MTGSGQTPTITDNMGSGQNLGGSFRKDQDGLQASGVENSETGEKDPEKGLQTAFDWSLSIRRRWVCWV